MSTCTECFAAFTGPQCSKCGAWYAVGPVGGPVSDSDFVDMTKVEAPAVERIDLGEPWNSVWGGGVVPTSSTLMVGPPGGAKSTLLLMLALRLAERTGKPAYYICSEMASSELRFILNRIGVPLKEGMLRVLKNRTSGGAIDRAVLLKTPPSALVVDSITDMVGLKDHHGHVALCKHFRALAKEFSAPAMLISQMSKGGAGGGDAYGLLALQHDVDTYVGVEGVTEGRRLNRLMREYEIEDGTDVRVIVALKNRFGPTNVDYPFAVTEKGLIGLKKCPTTKGTAKTGNRAVDALLARAQLVDQLEEAQQAVRDIKGEIEELDTKAERAALREGQEAARAAPEQKRGKRRGPPLTIVAKGEPVE